MGGAGEPRSREGCAARNGDPSEALPAVGWPRQSGRGHPGEETAWPAVCQGLGVGREWKASCTRLWGEGSVEFRALETSRGRELRKEGLGSSGPV